MKKNLGIGVLCSLIVLTINILIALRLFRLEYSAYLFSIEGQFIALSRLVAAHLGDLRWWPEWDCGLPFQNTYLPLLPVLVAFFSRVTGHAAAVSYHQVTAAAFCLGPVAVYWMAWVMSRSTMASFFAAWAYSVFSPCAAVVPAIRGDLHGVWNLRRLQVLAYWGEGPHTLSMAFVPLAILFLYLAIAHRRYWHCVLAGIFTGAVVLTNAFGAVILLLAVSSLLAVYATAPVWKDLGLLAAIGVLAYLCISPLVPPSVLAAVRMNSVANGYRSSASSLAGMGLLSAGFVLGWLAMNKARWPRHLRFSILFAWLSTGIVSLAYFAKIYVVPEPQRYQLAMDLALCLAAAFGVLELLRSAPRKIGFLAAGLALVFAFVGTWHEMDYGRRLIRSVDITRTAPYRIARWMDAHMHGQRVMIGGSYSFLFNNFTDTPQLQGGQDPFLPYLAMRIVAYSIYEGLRTNPRDGENSRLWLQAMGAHAILVPGPQNEEHEEPFSNPGKFEGLLPVLWREDDDTIYGVPARSRSLAHVIGPAALVHERPINGLDVGQLGEYVKALDSPEYPEATWTWSSRHSAWVHAVLAPGQVIATQVTYRPGWHATWNGRAQPTAPDGLGFLVVKPECQGPCDVAMWFDGGTEWRLTLCASTLAVFATLMIGGLCYRRSRRGIRK